MGGWKISLSYWVSVPVRGEVVKLPGCIEQISRGCVSSVFFPSEALLYRPKCFFGNTATPLAMWKTTQPWTVWKIGARTRDPKAIEVLKPKDIYGDTELEDGSALMPPISHICQKGMKPNSPNQACRGESVGGFFVPNLQGFCGVFPKNFWAKLKDHPNDDRELDSLEVFFYINVVLYCFVFLQYLWLFNLPPIDVHRVHPRKNSWMWVQVILSMQKHRI